MYEGTSVAAFPFFPLAHLHIGITYSLTCWHQHRNIFLNAYETHNSVAHRHIGTGTVAHWHKIFTRKFPCVIMYLVFIYIYLTRNLIQNIQHKYSRQIYRINILQTIYHRHKGTSIFGQWYLCCKFHSIGPLCRCAGVPMHQCAGAPVHWCVSAPVCRWSPSVTGSDILFINGCEPVMPITDIYILCHYLTIMKFWIKLFNYCQHFIVFFALKSSFSIDKLLPQVIVSRGQDAQFNVGVNT